MSYSPVRIGMPDGGIIAVVARSYEELTDAFIQQWMYELMRDYRVSPAYLLVSEKTRRELERLLLEDYHYSYLYFTMQESGTPERVACYPNKVTGEQMKLVIFPDLPEKTLFAASLLEMKEEYQRDAYPPVKWPWYSSPVVPAMKEIIRRYGPYGDEDECTANN